MERMPLHKQLLLYYEFKSIMSPPDSTDIPAAQVTMSNERTSLIASNESTVARAAYEDHDPEASRNFHLNRNINEEQHQNEGGLLKPLIFGGLDGILTAFAIVAGSAGGALDPSVVLILGFSNIFADALSMGVGEFLSSKAENEWIFSERQREAWEMENYPDGEVKEMIDIYEEKGMKREDAKLVIETMSKYKDFFVDVMMAEELELRVPSDDHITESFKEGIIMFCSFATFGSFPLLGYVIIPILFPDLPESVLFSCACIVTGLVLFLMGCVKSNFGAVKWYYCGMETLCLGGACATVAYTIGQYVDNIVASSAN